MAPPHLPPPVVTGVSVGLQAPAWIPFDSRMVVIYGRNGAGKTRHLESIRAALHGFSGPLPVALHLSGSPTAKDSNNVFGQVTHPDDTFEAIAEFWMRPTILGEFNQMESLDIEDPRLEPLAMEVAAGGRFILYPQDNGRFDLWAAADPARPATKAWLEELSRAREAAAAHFERAADHESALRWRSGVGLDLAGDSESLLYSMDDLELDVAFWLHPFLKAELDLPPNFMWFEPTAVDPGANIAAIWLAGTTCQYGGPIPVAPVRRGLGRADVTPTIATAGDADVGDLDSGLKDAVRVLGRRVTGPEARVWTDRVSAEATEICQELLLDGADLSVGHFGDSWTWAAAGALAWTATTRNNGRPRSLDELSAGEARWARLAAQLTNRIAAVWAREVNPEWTPIQFDPRHGYVERDIPTEPPVLILDEPEAHLHRAAEARMASALNELVGDRISLAIVATHSPQLLDLPNSHVYRAEGGRLQKLLDRDREDLHTLGLRPSDLLSITRVILLVEGEHERIVLGETIGAGLARHGVRILPIRGATQLPHTLDSQVLFRFSNAHLVALVDNVEQGLLERVWEQAYQAALIDGKDAAIDQLMKAIPGHQGHEARFIREWMCSAIAHGLQSRITPWGLRKPDILDYLPVDALVPGRAAPDWTSLHEAHERDLANGSKHKYFKTWLQKTRNADFSPDLIRTAAREMHLPDEFRLLLEECIRASTTARGPA